MTKREIEFFIGDKIPFANLLHCVQVLTDSKRVQEQISKQIMESNKVGVYRSSDSTIFLNVEDLVSFVENVVMESKKIDPDRYNKFLAQIRDGYEYDNFEDTEENSKMTDIQLLKALVKTYPVLASGDHRLAKRVRKDIEDQYEVVASHVRRPSNLVATEPYKLARFGGGED